MGKIDFGNDPFVPRIDDIDIPLNSGENENNEGTENSELPYDSDYQVRLATLGALGGDTTKRYDSVYEIDLEILRLTEEGGGGGASIEEVDVLPDAEENKNQIVRLSTDNKVYLAECISEGSAGSGFAAMKVETGDGGTFIYQRYSEGDDENGYAWAYNLSGDGCELDDNSIDWSDIDTSDLIYTNTLTPSIGDIVYMGEEEVTVTDYSPNAGYKPETWGWKQLGTSIQSITYAELKALRDNKQLIPGQQYRITDYATTTAQADTQSTGHPFDIIVTADGVDKLNESARATQHVSDAPVYYKWLYDNTGDSWLLSDASSYTNQVAGTCDISPMDGYDYYTTAYPIVGTIDENGDEPYSPGNLYRKAILYTEGDTLYYGDYIDEEKWDSWEEAKQEEDPSYIPQPYPEWFRGKYFLDEADTFTYDGTYQEGADPYFDNSKLESWELKYCLDNDTNRFSWAQVGQEGFAAIRLDWTYEGEDNWQIFKRYPEGDENSEFAWVAVDGGFDHISDVTDWSNVETGWIAYTNADDVYVGFVIEDFWDGASATVTEYSPDVDAIPSGKGVIYYMKDEFNNQVYFDFKDIMIFDDGNDQYQYLLGDDTDYTISGASNNNMIQGEIDDETQVLLLNSQSFGDVMVGYQNIVKYTAGSNIQIDNDNQISCTYSYSLPTASSSTLGGIKVGSGLYINSNGVLSNTYTLPQATTSDLGGIKVGYGVEVDSSTGKLSVTDEISGIKRKNAARLASCPEMREYLTFEAVDSCSVYFSYTNSLPRTIEISTDGGVTWVEKTSTAGRNSLSAGTLLATLSPGDKMYVRGNNSVYSEMNKGENVITATGDCYIYGNVMSLISSTNFENITTLGERAFYNLFGAAYFPDNIHILNHPTKKLVLPAQKISDRSYGLMFGRCVNLEKIYVFATVISGENTFFSFVPSGVYGTIYKDVEASIPSNEIYQWALENYNPEISEYIEGSADLTVDASGSVTAISNVIFDGYTDAELFDLTNAKVKMTFSYQVDQGGTIVDIGDICYGTLQKEITDMSMGGTHIGSVPHLIITFARMDLASAGHFCMWYLTRTINGSSYANWKLEVH